MIHRYSKVLIKYIIAIKKKKTFQKKNRDENFRADDPSHLTEESISVNGQNSKDRYNSPFLTHIQRKLSGISICSYII